MKCNANDWQSFSLAEIESILDGLHDRYPLAKFNLHMNGIEWSIEILPNLVEEIE